MSIGRMRKDRNESEYTPGQFSMVGLGLMPRLGVALGISAIMWVMVLSVIQG